MQEKKYLKNTAILFAAMIITKVVGALFKIPLANLLGGTGMGYFSTAYGLYSPIFALTAAGVPTVMMRITARNAAVGRCGYALAVKKTAMYLFTGIGLMGSILIIVFARAFAEKIACSPQSAAAVYCIAPAVMLCCTASVVRGYYEGLSNVMPSAAASVAEAVSRAAFGLTLSCAVLFYADRTFRNGGKVFGIDAVSAEEAYSAALPYAAAGAIVAVSISELCGLITLLIADKKRTCDKQPETSFSRLKICIGLIKDTAPIAASALVINCVSFVDLLTVSRTLSDAIKANPEYFSRAFSSVLASSGGTEGLPNFMYGSYTGIAMSLFMLIPSFAGMTEKAIAPEIAASWEKGSSAELSSNIFALFRSAALIGSPACFGAAALAEPILTALYKSRAAEVSVCRSSFVILCLGGIFMIVSSAMFGVFQSIGKAQIPLVLMICSVGIKLILNPVLISVPGINLSGAALSSAAGYVFMAVGGAIAMKKTLPVGVKLFSAVAPPAAFGMVCGAAAYIVSRLLPNDLEGFVKVAVSVFAGAVVYILLLIISGVFSASGIIKHKTPKKFQKPLEKKFKIG